MQKCGNPLHVEVGTKEFMNILVSFLNNKNLPQAVINYSIFKFISHIDLEENSCIDKKVGNKIRKGETIIAFI